MKPEHFKLHAFWDKRKEDASQNAARMVRMLGDLAATHPAFATWNKQANSRAAANKPYCAMPPNPEEFTRIFEKGRYLNDERPRKPMFDLGFMISAWNGQDDSWASSFTVHAGSYANTPLFPNWVDLSLPRPPSSVLSVETLSPVMRAIIGAWDPRYATVSRWSYTKLLEDPEIQWLPAVRSGWLTYICADYAKMIATPSEVQSERTADGGLLMIATDDLFETANPAHVAAAASIQHALAPVNALPPFVQSTAERRRYVEMGKRSRSELACCRFG